jgi:hypothetical protein
MSSAEHECNFSGSVCREVRSAVEVRREGHVSEHAEWKVGMQGVDRTVSVSLHGQVYVAQSLEHGEQGVGCTVPTGTQLSGRSR